LADGSWRLEVARIERGLREGLAPARDRGSEVRVLGAIGVIELDRPVDIAAATRTAVEHGVWLRPFRNLVYAMPPYVTRDEDVDRICRAMVACAS
jgi:adenosylmethionine-8-amino-7-oxononanoate aminotransferase